MDADAIEAEAAVGERPAVSLIEISRVLEETARLIRQHAPCREPLRPFDSRAELITAPLVRAIISVRRTRRDHFPCAPGDPAWSILLELFAARLEGRKTSQTLLGTAAAIPETTTIRLIKSLVRQGYLVSRQDVDDRRLVLLDLSDDAAERIRAYLTAAIVAGPFPF